MNTPDSSSHEALTDRIRHWADRWSKFAASESGRRVLRWTNWLFLGAIITFLIIKLRSYGVRQVVSSFPTTPWFYVLFVVQYVSLPLSERIIYGLSWRLPLWRSLGAFFKKRVYNRDVMGYAGEVYFFSWVHEVTQIGRKRILETIRDTNIISSIASTSVALVLVGVFAVRGEINIRDLIGENSGYVVASIVLLIVLIPIVFKFRRYVFSMQRKLALQILAIMTIRLIIGQIVQIAQWAVVLPDVAISAWFTLAAIGIVISRIPLISNQNLVFLGAGMTLADQIGLPAVEIAAMLLATTVLDKIVNAIVFAVTTRMERHHIRTNNNVDGSSVEAVDSFAE